MIQTPDQRLRVFVSSTMKELAAERAAVRTTIERLRLTPVLFELGARAHPPRDLYLAYIQQSHIFIGIYWQQYGWVAPGRDISGLEDEYLAATDKPRLVYLKAPAPDREPRLTAMLEQIAADGLSYHRFSTPEEVAELVANDLAVLISERFASSGTDAAQATQQVPRLPAVTSRFVGRAGELAELRRLLDDPQTRLITLVGPGGIGKTRLALQAITNSAYAPDGVAAVMLADVHAAELVPSAILAALGVPEGSGRTPRAAVVEFLRTRPMVLLLDNVEHVIDAAPFIGELLAAAAALKVIATSREILHLEGEQVFDVPPLDVPSDADPVAVLRQSTAVELFVDRARAARHDFQLDDYQLKTVAAICRRLEGLPLAIELAAARIRLFDPDQLLNRLERRFSLLTHGPRDLPRRQRTLRSAVGWSYDLLEASDRVLFERLGVFVGGFALEAAESVCQDERVPAVLDGLASLVDKSLLRTAGTVAGAPRFAMLETLREFALERLGAGDEAQRMQHAHADFFGRVVLASGPATTDPAGSGLADRYAADAGNIRAALRWLLDDGRPGAVAQMGAVLWRTWWVHGLFHEGIRWMEEVLRARAPLTDWEHAHASLALGMLAFGYGDDHRATSALGAAIAVYGRLGDGRAVATASTALGVITAPNEQEAGEAMIERAVVAFRELDDRWGLSFALLSLGGILLFRGGFAAAKPLLTEAADIARLAGIPIFVSNALVNLGRVHMGLGDLAAAEPTLVEGLRAGVAADDPQSIARSLEALAAAALAAGEPKRCALLFGAAEGVRRSIAAPVWAADRKSHEQTQKALRSQLAASEYRTVLDAGINLPLREAVHIASGGSGTDDAFLVGRDQSGRDEHEVSRLLDRSSAGGLITALFVDIVGSTDKVVTLGDRRWRQLLEAYLAMARQQLTRYEGSEIDTAGDGLFAAFQRPAQGVACAGAIRDASGAFGVQVRAGLHSGETQLISGKVGGVAVHIAARVAALAEPGEVLVSRTVRDLLAGSDLHFAHRGEHRLKGVSERWTVYRVEP